MIKAFPSHFILKRLLLWMGIPKPCQLCTRPVKQLALYDETQIWRCQTLVWRKAMWRILIKHMVWWTYHIIKLLQLDTFYQF